MHIASRVKYFCYPNNLTDIFSLGLQSWQTEEEGGARHSFNEIKGVRGIDHSADRGFITGRISI